MNNLPKRRSIVAGFINVGLAICIMVLIVYVYRNVTHNSCTKLVTLNNGETFRVEWIRAYSSGYVDMRKCNGERVQFPTNNVEAIKDIEE